MEAVPESRVTRLRIADCGLRIRDTVKGRPVVDLAEQSAIRDPQSAIVVVGASLGGLSALQALLSDLPEAFPLPVVVAQHRAVDSADLLQKVLRRHSRLRVREPQDKEAIQPGRVYVAPADYHLLVEPGAFALSTQEIVCCARPSIDVLFESAADSYAEKVIAVILTGSNKDGARGAARVKACGGFLVVQEPHTAESPVMPEAVLAATRVDRVLPLAEIAPFLLEASGVRREA
jgi:two-component system, chemotaxis family, protein-glutamate methylesterase/glutaminase